MSATIRCTACNQPIEGPRATVTFEGFTTAALNRTALPLHPGCLRLQFPESEPLPPRISDPVAESGLVSVDSSDLGWEAWCLEHGNVAIKGERDDAHLAAAHHLARVHVGVLS